MARYNQKQSSSNPIQKVISAISNFNKNVENSFESRAKESNLVLSILIFLIIGLASTINQVTVLDSFLANFLYNILFLFLVILITWLIGAILFKSKTSFRAFFSAIVWPMLLLAFISYRSLFDPVFFYDFLLRVSYTLLFGAFSIFDFIILALYLYLSSAVAKKVLNLSYSRAFLSVLFGLLFALYSTFVFLPFVFLNYFYLPYYSAETAISPTSYIIDNADGSFTAIYTYIYEKTNKSQRGCNVTFPPGWGYGDQKIFNKIYYIERNKMPNYEINDSVFYKLQFNESNPEYFIFGDLPFVWIGEDLIRYQIKYLDRKPYAFQQSIVVLNISGTEILDVNITNGEKDFSKHILDLRSPVGVGFTDAVYRAPYNQDQDLYFILNNTKCYYYKFEE